MYVEIMGMLSKTLFIQGLGNFPNLALKKVVFSLLKPGGSSLFIIRLQGFGRIS